MLRTHLSMGIGTWKAKIREGFEPDEMWPSAITHPSRPVTTMGGVVDDCV